MNKLVKLLGVLAVVGLASGTASAATVLENFTFSWNTNGPWNLSSLSYASPSSGNLLSGPFTTGPGVNLPSGPGSFSQVISVDTTQSYTTHYVSSLTGTSFSSNISVSAVPLPASFPLFAMALLALGVIGYRTSRNNRQEAVAA